MGVCIDYAIETRRGGGREKGDDRCGGPHWLCRQQDYGWATTWFYGRQSEESKRREEELAPGGSLLQLGKQLGGATGRKLSDEEAARLGVAIHRTFGVSYGVAASALVRAGVHPLAAGLAVGTAAFLVVDEGTALSLFTAYPLESHMRGVVGHATWGLAAGIMLSLITDPG